MPQQLLLEGPDLEALLLRARDEYGASVKVVRAEKVRTGGFMGFFTREHYELTLEVPDAEPGTATEPPASATPGTSAPRTAGVSRDHAIDRALAAEIADARAAREAMLASVSGAEPFDAAAKEPITAAAAKATTPEAPAAKPESTDMAEFDRLVLQLTESANVQTENIRAESIQTESIQTESVGRSFVKASFPAAPPATPRIASPSAGDGPDEAIDASAAQPVSPVKPTAPAPVVHVPSGDGDVVLNRWGVFTDVAGAVATRCTVPALLALGVPRRFTRAFDDLDANVPLLDVIAGFGVPPVRRPEAGDLVVIAGPADEAVSVATQVAAWLGMPATAVALAGDIEAIRGHGRRIRTEPEARAARRRADKAAQLGEPLIVAFGITPGRRGAAVAGPMLAAFDADTVWVVVDATKRAEVNEPGIALLSKHARVDAIAAVGLAEAQAPAAVLDSSLPIAWMDGLPAASVVWAALLGERIAAAN